MKATPTKEEVVKEVSDRQGCFMDDLPSNCYPVAWQCLDEGLICQMEIIVASDEFPLRRLLLPKNSTYHDMHESAWKTVSK